MRGLSWYVVLLACATACGGESASRSNDDEDATGGIGGAGGTAGSGAGTAGASAGTAGAGGMGSGGAGCEGPVTPPALELFPACESFVPSLGPQDLDWVGLDPFDGEFMVHRFR